MKHWEDFIRIFRLGARLKSKSQVYIIYAGSALLLSATSIGMTIMNIKREFYLMAAITASLAALLLLCAYLSGIRKKELLSSVIAAAAILFIFSYFAVSGQNEGFAILWILLVPLFSTSIFEMRIGIGLSFYFLLFSFILFYTPLNGHIADCYTDSFIERFPVLYLCTFLVSIFLFLQKEFYSRSLQIKSNMDELTGTYNRRYFTNFIMHAPLPETENTCVMLIDVNGLKEVNDTYGHDAGDELIRAVPQCCHEVISSDFTLCRLGGDEFVLIMQIPEDDIATLTDDIKRAGLNWQGTHSQSCQLSIGWASSDSYPEYAVDELYRAADARMYQDKAEYYRQPGNERRKSNTAQ